MISSSNNNILDSYKMMYFMNYKDMSKLENFFILLLMLILTFVFNNENIIDQLDIYTKKIFNYINIYNSNSIILEGKTSFVAGTHSCKTDNIFSDRFEAFWFYISKHNFNNKTIKSIREIPDNFWSDNYCEMDSNNFKDFDLDNIKTKNLFIVNQSTPFVLDNDIFCKVDTFKSRSDDKDKIEIENIKIIIYSYNKSLDYLSKMIDNICIEYKTKIDNSRYNKKYIYTLNNTNSSDNNLRDNNNNTWLEYEFNSSRTFNNLFFEDKKILLNKINFFTENKDWYDYEGHPWTLGISLYGSPGTGKTSIIKSIANKLNRHIIIIPLNKIKTQSQFNKYFFEYYYSRNNYKKIDFKEKIIVFEDIDCMSNIVKKRNIESNDNIDTDKNIESVNLDKTLEKQTHILNKIAEKVIDDHNDYNFLNKSDDSDNITLSYILNIIDGIRETPGRILIITSNDYNSLDPALIRPGRIDITLEMKNASIDIIKEMYAHYYNNILPSEVEKCIKNNILSPAKIVNLRLQYPDKDNFIQALLKEFN
tara:strand:+ start:96 stop:1697 length:1602 start_codon:yes stop_codon:yes gene_type:complete